MTDQERITVYQKMHAVAAASHSHYAAQSDTEKATFWIGQMTAFSSVLKTFGSEPDATEIAKAKVDLAKLREVQGKDLIKEKEETHEQTT